MAKSRRFSLQRLIRSFTYAGKGVAWVWQSEPNFKIHCLAAVVATIFGLVLKISYLEWLIVILCAGIVTAAEAFNTALEFLADATHPDKHPLIGKAKDASAGAVLLCALASLIAGAMIFVPKIWQVIKTMQLPAG